MKRTQMAEALKMSYTGYDQWEGGKTDPGLSRFADAAQLVGYSLDELYYGRAMPAIKLDPTALVAHERFTIDVKVTRVPNRR
jgi:transcriptional regulator with XRE-family HTH domain